MARWIIGALAALGVALAACASEQTAPPAQPERSASVEQVEPLTITPARAVIALGEIADAADVAILNAAQTTDCSMASEGSARAAREYASSAERLMGELTLGMLAYLEEAPLTELAPANEILSEAEAQVASAKSAIERMGSCGLLDDGELDALSKRIQTRVGIYIANYSFLQSRQFTGECSVVVPKFNEIDSAREEIFGLIIEFSEGRGTREREGVRLAASRVQTQQSELQQRDVEHRRIGGRIAGRCE